MGKSRILTFQFIADDRFNQDKSYLEELDLSLKDAIDTLQDIVRIIDETPIIELSFGEPEPGKQWRKRYCLSKTRDITWDGLYAIINSVQANPYEFLK